MNKGRQNAHSRQYWTGNGGEIWLNGVTWDRIKSFEIKLVPEWEDVPDGMITKRVLLGIKVEGSLTYRRTDINYRNIIDQIASYYMTGDIPDIDLVVKDENVATGESYRIKATGLTFNELDLMSWEEKTLTEIELSFEAETVEPLD